MFFTIKSGADDNQVFNGDCMAWQLVDSITRRCQCRPDDTLALVDTEVNQVINLGKIGDPTENGCNLFKDREVYVLLSVSQDMKSKEVTYTPLLDEEFIDPMFSIKLESLTHNKKMKRSTTTTISRKKITKLTKRNTVHAI